MSSSRWFRIVSTRIAVLPVPRSPMISSRWPRPIGIIESIAFLDMLPLAEKGGADVVLLEVEREAGDPVLELEHLERHGILEPVDAGDPVAYLEHAADLGEVGLHVVLLDPSLEDRGDLFGSEFQWTPF